MYLKKIKLKVLGLFILLPVQLTGALGDLEPNMPYLIHLDATYSFANIPRIQGAVNPVNYRTNENKLTLSSWMSTMSYLEFGALFEFNQTVKLPFNLESGGFYLKKAFFDDLSGDLFSFDGGLLVQFVPTNRLRDPITPYNDVANFSLFGEIFKNFVFDRSNLCFTPYLAADLGIANRGYPWLDPAVGGRLSYDRLSFDLSILGTFGFGNLTVINVNAFRGYAMTAYRAIDIELFLGYSFAEEGFLSVGYFGRLFARAFPQDRQGFFIQLDLPLPVF